MRALSRVLTIAMNTVREAVRSKLLYVLLFFLFSFSGRWPVLSHSLLRFDWSSMLVLSICMLKKERFVLAGACMAYAALNRIFPAIFFYPWVVVAAYDIIKQRRLPMRHIKFVAGAAVVTALLVGIAMAAVTTAFTARLEEPTGLPLYFRFVVIPMFLFSGAFFPISQLPGWLQPVALATPMYHGVELSRAIVVHIAPL